MSELEHTSSGKYVTSVGITAHNQSGINIISIKATMKTIGVSAGIRDDNLEISSSDGGKTWDCGYNSYNVVIANHLGNKYLPVECRQ